MSGEAKARGKGKKGGFRGKKGSHTEDEEVSNGIGNGHASKRKQERLEAAGGASILTKLVFSVLLITFTLVASVYLVDYKQGQLAKLTASLPPEVRQAATKGDQLLSQLADNVKGNVAAAKTKVEQIARGIDIGEKGTLGDLIFGPDQAAAKKAADEAAAKKAAAEEKAKKAAADKAKIEAERLEAEKAAAEKAAAEKAAAEKAAAEKAAAEKAAAEKAAAEKAAAEKAAAEKAAAEKAAAQKAAAEEAAR